MSEVIQASPETTNPESDQVRHLDALIASVDDRLAMMDPVVQHVLQLRHDLGATDEKYKLTKTMFDDSRPTSEQSYDEPTYNDVFVYGYDSRTKVVDDDQSVGGDLNARKGANFHEGETYDDGEYSRAILNAADKLGFIKKEVGRPGNELDESIGVTASDLEPIGRVEAYVVAGAAGVSDLMRPYDALRNITEGRVDTNELIFATCDRPTSDGERERFAAAINKAYRALGNDTDFTTADQAGKTEFDLLVTAVSMLTQTEIDSSQAKPFPVKLGKNTFDGTLLQVDMTVVGKPLHCNFINTPYDPDRVKSWDKDGNPVKANRANTEETFIAALSLLNPGAGTVLVGSHDTWTIGQGVIAEQIFGIAGKDVIATGPRKLDRVVEKTNDAGETYISLSQPEGVIDEIAKTYAYLPQTRIIAENARHAITNG